MSLKIYGENDLDIHIVENGWKGNGTKESPFIIESRANIEDTIKIKNITRFLHVKNCDFHSIYLRNCKNIAIENNKIQYLDLFNCSKIIINNNKIFFIEILHSPENIIQNNKLRELVLNNLIKFSDPKSQYLNLLKYILFLIIGFSITSIIFGIPLFTFEADSTAFIVLSVIFITQILGLIAEIINFIIHTTLYKKVKNGSANKILNNSKLLDLEDFN